MGATKQVLIKLNDAIVDVVGYYSKGWIGDRETPPESSDFEIEKVIYKDVDILPTMSDNEVIELSDRCVLLIEN